MLSAPLAFGPFVLDPAQARLLRDGRPVALAGKPLDVLVLLARHPGQLLTKDAVLDAVWGHRHVSESVLKTAINTVRIALGDDARAPACIETVPRRGYRFIAALRSVTDAPQATATTAPPAPQQSGLPANAAAMSPAPAGNLPLAADPTVGREAELAQLLALMASHRLVTLTGLGGVGKTRLALAAASAAAAPPDGVWLLRLDDLTEPGPLLPTLAALLRLGAGAAAGLPALAQALAGQRLRLVLDNAEHLVDAVAALAAAVLAAAPGVQLLVTSQMPLRLRGEQVLPLAPLALPDDLGHAAPPPDGYAAARLLCLRIGQQRAGWQPEPGDAADIAAICRTLDGVPLALELAAARVPVLGLAGVRARLHQRFALLTRGARDGAARHRTLAAALDWTFGLLQPAERRALQRLAVFAGSFSVADAEGVLAGLDGIAPLDAVDELRERSLLVLVDAGQAPRLRLYDSVRRHALDGLDGSGQGGDARDRLLHWLAGRLADGALTYLSVPAQHWLPTLHADMDSLRVALRHGLAPSASPQALADAVRLLGQVMVFWVRGGHRSEGRQWLALATQRLAEQPPGCTAELAWWVDLASAVLGTLGLQLPLADTVAAIDRALAHPLAQADAAARHLLFYFGFHAGLRVRDGREHAMLQGMVSSLQPGWVPLARRLLLSAEGLLVRNQGDLAGYARAGDAFAALCRSAGAEVESVVGDAMAAQALALTGQLDGGCARYAQATQTLQRLGLLREYPDTVAMAAALHLQRGLDAHSRALALQALRLLAPAGMLWCVADALAWAAWHDGRPADAARLQRWADAAVQARGEQRGPIFAAMRAGLEQAVAQALGEGALAAVDPSHVPVSDAAAVQLALGPDAADLAWPAPAAVTAVAA